MTPEQYAELIEIVEGMKLIIDDLEARIVELELFKLSHDSVSSEDSVPTLVGRQESSPVRTESESDQEGLGDRQYSMHPGIYPDECLMCGS